jgi:hypothetical protein
MIFASPTSKVENIVSIVCRACWSLLFFEEEITRESGFRSNIHHIAKDTYDDGMSTILLTTCTPAIYCCNETPLVSLLSANKKIRVGMKSREF